MCLTLILLVGTAPSPARGRTLIAKPQGIVAGPTIAGEHVAWAEGPFGKAIEIRLGRSEVSARTVARFADPRRKHVYQFIDTLVGSDTALAFIRGTYRSVTDGDYGEVTELGSELYSGSPEGPFVPTVGNRARRGATCTGEAVGLEAADLDGTTVALLESVHPCVNGRLGDLIGRISLIDLVSGARSVLDEQPMEYGPHTLRMEGAFVAWGLASPASPDVVTVYDRTTGNQVYLVDVATDVSALDIQADGKIAAMRRLTGKDGFGSARAVPVWFSLEEPYEHALPFRGWDTAPIEIADDRIVFETLDRHRPAKLVATTLDGTSSTIATFAGRRRLAAGRRIDLEGRTLTYAERRPTDEGREVTIYRDDISEGA